MKKEARLMHGLLFSCEGVLGTHQAQIKKSLLVAVLGIRLKHSPTLILIDAAQFRQGCVFSQRLVHRVPIKREILDHSSFVYGETCHQPTPFPNRTPKKAHVSRVRVMLEQRL